MKQTKLSDVLITLAVIGCSAILLAALSIALTGFSFGPSRTVDIDFGTVTGVKNNSEVRYAGKTIGRIASMRFLTPEEQLANPGKRVRVTARLDGEIPALLQGATATITSDTVLAEKFIDLRNADFTSGQSLPPPLDLTRDIIPGQSVVGIDDLTREGYRSVAAVSGLLTRLEQDYPDLHTRIGSLITRADESMESAESLLLKLDTLIAKNDPEIQATLRDLRVTMQNLKVTTTYAKAFAGTIGEKPWRVLWGGKPNELPPEEEILGSDQPTSVRKPAPAKK
jgi:ABC-type transporter Mla subunit MlaD